MLLACKEEMRHGVECRTEYLKEETVWKEWEGGGEGGRRILKCIAKKWGRRMCIGFMWLRVEVRGGL
jgi:hypothetical protein